MSANQDIGQIGRSSGRPDRPPCRDAAGVVHDAVMEALRPMGLNKATILRYGGASTNVGGANEKQPDCGWGPRRRPRGVANRPSVVLEVGLSEPETQLRNDARMWVDPTRGEANMAITIRVNPRKPMITIQTWDSWQEPQEAHGQGISRG